MNSEKNESVGFSLGDVIGSETLKLLKQIGKNQTEEGAASPSSDVKSNLEKNQAQDR